MKSGNRIPDSYLSKFSDRAAQQRFEADVEAFILRELGGRPRGSWD